MGQLFNGFEKIESLSSSIQSLADSLKFLGVLSLILILLIIILVAVFLLAPSIIALVRRTKLRRIVIVINVVSIFLFLVNFVLPFAVWGILLLIAILGRKEIKPTINMPPIIINTSSSQVQNSDTKER